MPKKKPLLKKCPKCKCFILPMDKEPHVCHKTPIDYAREEVAKMPQAQRQKILDLIWTRGNTLGDVAKKTGRNLYVVSEVLMMNISNGKILNQRSL